MIFCVDENERANRIVSLASLVASRTRVSRVSRVVSSESAPPRATHLRVHPAHGLRQRIRGVRHGARCLPSSRSPILARVRGVRRDRGVARASAAPHSTTRADMARRLHGKRFKVRERRERRRAGDA
jgi:hypothetical protein